MHLRLLLMVPLWFVSCAHAHDLKEGLNLHRKLAETAGKDGWYHAVSTLGSFEAELPIPFNDATIKVTESDGKEALAFIVGSTSQEGIKFSITEMKALKKIDESALREVVSAMARREGTEVLDVQYFDYQNYPACSFEVKRGAVRAFQQQVLLPDRMLSATIEFPEKLRDTVIPIRERVFASLGFKEPNRVPVTD